MSPTVPLIICRVEEYSSAGEVFGTIGTDVVTTHTGLLGVLQADAGMAGSDSVATEWAAAYDQAAGLALQASAELATASGQMRDLITIGVYNHQSGEAAADANDMAPPPQP